MSSQALTTTERSARLKVTGRLKRALDMMVWEGASDNEAAVKTNMHVLSIRVALQRPHVKAYYQAQRQVLRERESPRNIHTLIAVRDQTANQMARVQAVKALEQISDDPQGVASRGQTAGLVIMIGTSAPADMGHIREIDAKPLNNNKVVPHEE